MSSPMPRYLNIDWKKKMQKIDIIEKDGQLFFERLSLNERIQHFLLFVSFTLLAVTGLPLKFHHTDWGSWLYGLVGGITYAPLIHRISAVVMTAVFIYHAGYALYCAWENYLKPLKNKDALTLKSGVLALLELPMVPNLTDLKELISTLKYFLFINNKPPSLVAHGLKEKFGYLAVFWGVPVIGISGFFLWGETFFTQYFSGHVLNFAYIAHSDEAFLASIVIFIWHLYNVHFAPAVFPMGRAWLDGYVGEREMIQYHYHDYVKAMKAAGMDDRIKSQQTAATLNTGFFRRCFEKCYMALMIVAVCYATVIISRVIYESVFVLHYQIVTTEPAIEEPLIEPQFLEEIRLENTEKTQLFRGYRFVREKQIKNHYHRIELNISPEKISHCITCHGDLPHAKSTHIRSFLNMHNLYFACQTCHVRPAEKNRKIYYYWYNREDGLPVFNPQIGNRPIDELNIKLAPCETCTAPPDETDIRNARAKTDGYMKTLQAESTSITEKKEIVKTIHERVSETPISCNECHTRKDPLLPLTDLGYPKYRAEQVASDQITKMINEYKEFHTPAFLEPGKYRKNNDQ